MTTNILVTGSTRSVGREVAHLLAAQPDVYVRAATSNVEAARAEGWRGVEIVPFDYDDPATYPGVFEGMQRLLLVMPPGDLAAHDQAIPDLVNYACDAGVGHVVFISALGTERIFLSSQWQVERHLQSLDCRYTILRSGWFFQNFCSQPLLRDGLREGRLVIATGPDARVSGVDVRDVAAVAAQALVQPHIENAIYTLGDYPMTPDHLARVFSEVLGRAITPHYVTEHEAGAALRAKGMPRHVAKWWMMVYQIMRQGAYSQRSPDVARLLDRPPITFRQYVQQHADCWAAPPLHTGAHTDAHTDANSGA